MFVHDFTYIERPAGAVRARILDGGGHWLGALATGAADDGRAVLMRVGPLPGHPLFGKAVLVEAGAPYDRPDAAVIPLTWTAAGTVPAFPVLRADLEVAPIGDDRTELTLRGSYDPPFGDLGRRLDALIFHRVAEACVRSFLIRVASVLEDVPPGRVVGRAYIPRPEHADSN